MLEFANRKMLFAVVLCSIGILSALAAAADTIPSDAPDSVASAKLPALNPGQELGKMQVILDKIKSEVSNSPSDDKLVAFKSLAKSLTEKADSLQQSLIPLQQQLAAQLAVLGKAPGSGSGLKETADVGKKRASLTTQKNRLDKQVQQARELVYSGNILGGQIQNLLRDQLKTRLALNSGSLLSTQFWLPLVSSPSGSEQISEFIQDGYTSIVVAFAPHNLLLTGSWLLAAFLTMILGRRYMERFLAWVSMHKLPEGRLRRSFLAMAVVLTTLFSVVVAFNCLTLALFRLSEVAEVRQWVSKLERFSFLCGLIAGLGRAFLSNRRPSWRLAPICDEIAQALRQIPMIIAVALFILQAIEYTNETLDMPISISLFSSGVIALLIGLFCVGLVLRIHQIRRRLENSGQEVTRTRLTGIIEIALFITGIAILSSLVIGYLAFARFLSYEVIWCAILFSSYYLLYHLVKDSCDTLFSPLLRPGKALQNNLNLKARNLEQMGSLLTAILRAGLTFFLILILSTGTISSATPIEIMSKVVSVLDGKGLEKLKIVPSHLLFASITLLGGILLLRRTRRWLETDFLPKTTMDSGIRASLLTLVSNLGYVLVIILTLAMLGIQWSKLAWIVSALSVGIGFGLQEIVKNFISGLILLTERPIKVGDLIGISGIEGDVKRINVRATEIQLADKSTLIVPNSQLISQNVRNATMGNAPGVVTIPMTFPLDIDPIAVKEILLDVFAADETILQNPAPSVSFKDLSAQGILLSVTGYVSSQRLISSVKSDLLFELLVQLRQHKISLSEPQALVIARKTSS